MLYAKRNNLPEGSDCRDKEKQLDKCLKRYQARRKACLLCETLLYTVTKIENARDAFSTCLKATPGGTHF